MEIFIENIQGLSRDRRVTFVWHRLSYRSFYLDRRTCCRIFPKNCLRPLTITSISYILDSIPAGWTTGWSTSIRTLCVSCRWTMYGIDIASYRRWPFAPHDGSHTINSANAISLFICKIYIYQNEIYHVYLFSHTFDTPELTYFLLIAHIKKYLYMTVCFSLLDSLNK